MVQQVIFEKQKRLMVAQLQGRRMAEFSDGMTRLVHERMQNTIADRPQPIERSSAGGEHS